MIPSQVGLPIMGGLGLVIVAMYLGWSWQVTELEADVAVYKDRIEREDTGYVAQLAQCRTNNAGLIPRIERLGADVTKLGDDTKARDATLAANMKGAAAAAAGAKAAGDALLALPREAAIGTLEACAAGARAYRGEP